MILLEFLVLTGILAIVYIAARTAYRWGRKVQKDEDSETH